MTDKSRQGKNNHARGKAFEKLVAKHLGGKRVERKSFGESAPDIVLHDFPHLKIDCKSRKVAWVFSQLSAIKMRYCRSSYDVPVLPVKQKGRQRYCIVVPGKFFASLLNSIRGLRGRCSELEEHIAGQDRRLDEQNRYISELEEKLAA